MSFQILSAILVSTALVHMVSSSPGVFFLWCSCNMAKETWRLWADDGRNQHAGIFMQRQKTWWCTEIRKFDLIDCMLGNVEVLTIKTSMLNEDFVFVIVVEIEHSCLKVSLTFLLTDFHRSFGELCKAHIESAVEQRFVFLLQLFHLLYMWLDLTKGILSQIVQMFGFY